jgi:ferredoxin
MLRKIRIIVAWVVVILATLLVLDFTGALHKWLGWVAKIQLVPAILAFNVVALAVVALLTVLFGRIYCSTLCPLGIMQDGISNLSGRRKGKKARFRYSKPLTWLRYGLLVLFIVALFVAALGAVTSLLDPWANFGRIAQNLFSPLARWGNNLLAWVAERADTYAFYEVDVLVKSWIAFGVALVWLIGLAVLAWWKGRIYCNSVCPVGTFLGLVSRVSIFRPTFDKAKCTNCGLCEKSCKSECIDSRAMTIDPSRCVACFNCIDKCKFDAMHLRPSFCKGAPAVEPSGQPVEATPAKKGISRRSFFSVAALAIASTPAAVKAQQALRNDGGLADIVDKKRTPRITPITPPGSGDARNMQRKCVACQLCVAACPNNVLVPSSRLATLMQPEMTFERGYCRPECVECSQVCPTGAIEPITAADKTDIAVGTAHYNRELCVVPRDKVPCTACQRHCPTGAITLVPLNAEEAEREQQGGWRRPPILKVPVVDTTLCIGCGACENLCPSRPVSAIRVEGNLSHHQL